MRRCVLVETTSIPEGSSEGNGFNSVSGAKGSHQQVLRRHLCGFVRCHRPPFHLVTKGQGFQQVL